MRRWSRSRARQKRSLRMVALAAYLVVVVVIVLPVVLTSVGGDDRYWLLEKPPVFHGSPLAAFTQPLQHALDTDRATAISFGERQAVATVAMNLSVLFTTPPVLWWALIKLGLLVAAVALSYVVLRTVRYRRRDGAVTGLAPTTVTAVTLSLPLAFALGAKTQNVELLNGWLFYPTLTYGLFPVLLGYAALAMRLTDGLDRAFRRRWAPTVVGLVVLALIVNFSYELLYLTVPVVIFSAITRPHATEGSRLIRWRPALTVAASFTVAWGVFYVVVRRLIASQACGGGETCYPGTVLDPHARTLLTNFVGVFPVGTRAVVADQARQLGVGFPSPGGVSVALGVLGVVCLGWLLLADRHRCVPPGPPGEPDAPGPATASPTGSELRGAAIVVALGLGIAVGAALITGATEAAVRNVTSAVTPYRVGPVAWCGVALAAVTAATVAVRRLPRRIAWVPSVVVLAAVAVTVAVVFPRNVVSAQANRDESSLVDQIQTEVAVGATGPGTDARRCRLVRTLADRHPPARSGTQRVVNGAYDAFAWYHQGRRFCHTLVGYTSCPRQTQDTNGRRLPCAADQRRGQ